MTKCNISKTPILTLYFVLISGLYSLCHTQESNLFFHSGTEIVVDYFPENDIFYIHTMDKGISVYSLAQIFQVPLEKLMTFNNLHPNLPINTGKIVNVPLDERKITQFPKNNQNYLKLLYKVKKKETLYSLSRKFKTDVPTLLKLNNKNTNVLNEDEFILIGFFIIGIDNSMNSQPDTARLLDTPKILKFYLSDVIGYWDKNSTNTQLFVLHNEAKIGSFMDIYNPMLQRHSKAKVIGRIPEGTYFTDVEIILSPQCAKIMGILDSRFKVNIKYEK